MVKVINERLSQFLIEKIEKRRDSISLKSKRAECSMPIAECYQKPQIKS